MVGYNIDTDTSDRPNNNRWLNWCERVPCIHGRLDTNNRWILTGKARTNQRQRQQSSGCSEGWLGCRACHFQAISVWGHLPRWPAGAKVNRGAGHLPPIIMIHRKDERTGWLADHSWASVACMIASYSWFLNIGCVVSWSFVRCNAKLVWPRLFGGEDLGR